MPKWTNFHFGWPHRRTFPFGFVVRHKWHCHLPFSRKRTWKCSIAPFINFVMAFEHRKLRHLICYALWFYSKQKEKNGTPALSKLNLLCNQNITIFMAHIFLYTSMHPSRRTNNSWTFCIVYHSSFNNKGTYSPVYTCTNSIWKTLRE